MRLQRLVVGLLGAALLGAVPVALTATSAEAGTTAVTTRVNFDKQAKSVYKYGTKIVISGAIEGQRSRRHVGLPARHHLGRDHAPAPDGRREEVDDHRHGQ